MPPRRPKEGARFTKYFGPLLDALRDLGGSARPSEATERIAESLGISQAEQDEVLDSGSARFYNAVQWARFYLVREGLIDGSTRGVLDIDANGSKYSSHTGAITRDLSEMGGCFFKSKT